MLKTCLQNVEWIKPKNGTLKIDNTVWRLTLKKRNENQIQPNFELVTRAFKITQNTTKIEWKLIRSEWKTFKFDRSLNFE